MTDQHSSTPRLAEGKPTSWWGKAPVTAIAVTALAAALLLAWIYLADRPQKNSTGDAPTATHAPDAVQRVLSAGKPTVIEFGANSCASCREMKPVLHALSLDPRIAVADVDILKERSYISKYQIRLMPTQVFYNAQGEEIGRHMGKISAEGILAQLGLAPVSTRSTDPSPKAAL